MFQADQRCEGQGSAGVTKGLCRCFYCTQPAKDLADLGHIQHLGPGRVPGDAQAVNSPLETFSFVPSPLGSNCAFLLQGSSLCPLVPRPAVELCLAGAVPLECLAGAVLKRDKSGILQQA